MADIVEFPIEKQVAQLNRLASSSAYSDPREELVASLRLLLANAEHINIFPASVMDTVLIEDHDTEFRAWGVEHMLEAVEREIWKARHSLAQFRLSKQQLLKE